MGDWADSILDGDFDEETGDYIGEGDGFPRSPSREARERENIMETSELIYIASVAVGKNMDYEDLKYSDYLYGKETEVGNVWPYVEECNEIGRAAFREKYKEYKLFPI